MAFRILLLSADFGSGHLTAARAIAAHCQCRNPECDPVVVQVRSPILTISTWIYLWWIHHTPSFYRWIYHLPVGGLQRLFFRLTLGHSVRRAIRRYRPDLIIGTHPFPAGVAAHLRHHGEHQIPVIMVLTDFLPHGFWVWEGVERYCVASERAAAEILRFGIDPGRVAATGIPVRSEFAREAPSVNQPPLANLKRVLVMGGGLGLGPIVESVRSLATLPHPELQATVICGTNTALERELRDLFTADGRIRVIGYTSDVVAHMAQADLLVTKPGGITCSEAMALGLPMLLLHPLPGHEEENARHLVEVGAGQVTDEHHVGTDAARLLFERPEALNAMREHALRAGRPRSSEAIANEIFIRSAQNPHPDAIVG